MADTSQRKPIYQNKGNNTQIDRNRYSTPKPKGNEVAGNVYNLIRSEGINFTNAENFSQTDASFTITAKDVYTESELALQALETKKARLSYTVTFNANVYTLTAKTSTVSEIIDGTFNNQEFQDKTVRNSVVTLFDGFHTSFIAPSANTASASVSIQLYDGTFTTKTLKKYSGATLIDLVANDIIANNKYDVVIIGGEAVLFGIKEVSTLVPKQIILSYVNGTTLNYTSGTFDADDYSGRYSVTAGTINLAANGLNGLDTGSIPVSAWLYIYAIYNPTTKISGAIASLSSTTPTLPSGFTIKRYIGALKTSVSAIIPFTQVGNVFIRSIASEIVNGVSSAGFTTTITNELPSGVSIKAIVGMFLGTTQNGFSTMAVWGSLQETPANSINVNVSTIATNNGFGAAGTGIIYTQNGNIFWKNPLFSAGVALSKISLISYQDFNI